MSHLTDEALNADQELYSAWHAWCVSHDCYMDSRLLHPIRNAALAASAEHEKAIRDFIERAKSLSPTRDYPVATTLSQTHVDTHTQPHSHTHEPQQATWDS